MPEGESLVYWLGGSQPNPFGPTTTIQYSLAERGTVRIAIYDVAGRLVRALVDGVEDAGRHAVSWDGLSGSGDAMASGVYFIRYDAGGCTFTRKAALLR